MTVLAVARFWFVASLRGSLGSAGGRACDLLV